MSADKLVDSTLLDAACTYEAGKIREKLGSSAQIAYDFANGKGFGDAIAAIPTGGGVSGSGLMAGTEPIGEIDISGTYKVLGHALNSKNAITKITGTIVGNQNSSYWFNDCTGLIIAHIHIVGTASGVHEMFRGCSNMTTVVLRVDGNNSMNSINHSCSKLEVADYSNISPIQSNAFYNNYKLKTIILRRNSICTLSNTGAIATNTPFKSGGTGGTIYIPKALYDHLGDGSSSDYKAATNWSTVDGYGTITWAQIEGSIYETQYADGTPIT